MNTSELLQNAQSQIAVILKRVEEETGREVEAVSIQEMDVSTMTEPDLFLRSVRIDLKRNVERRW